MLICFLVPPSWKWSETLNYAQQKVFTAATYETNTHTHSYYASRVCLSLCLCLWKDNNSGRAKIETDAVATNMQHTLGHCIIWQQSSEWVRAGQKASSSHSRVHSVSRINYATAAPLCLLYWSVCVCALNADALAYAWCDLYREMAWFFG